MGLMKMVDKKILAVAVGAIFVLGIYGPNLANIVQTAEAHGVQAQLQSRFIQITDESISRQSLSTGETLVLTGTLVSLVERDQRGWISLFSESTNSGRT
jgi:methane/ammonia monooxygenase subunit B